MNSFTANCRDMTCILSSDCFILLGFSWRLHSQWVTDTLVPIDCWQHSGIHMDLAEFFLLSTRVARPSHSSVARTLAKGKPRRVTPWK